MGEVFAGRYELIDPIGRGGAGAVWRAWDHRRRRYVAAKVLLQSDAHTLLRFVREQALRIDHPHVLAPASWAADDDKVLFTMDLVGGGSLGHVIGDYGPLPPRFVCGLLDQLLSGLAAVHAEGVVHRDIKPANILMEATGTGRPHLRLSDFGISMRKGEPRLTETDLVVGTPGYFAPEQLLGAEPDFPADLFAVGLVALYLLQGRKPDSRALVEHFFAHGTPGAPEGVPAPLWDVIAGLLQPDPQNRFRTATGARKALVEAVELLPPPAPDEDPVEVFDQLGPLPPGFGPQGPPSTAATTPRAPDAGAPEAASAASVTAPAEPVRTDPRGTARTAPVALPAPPAPYPAAPFSPASPVAPASPAVPAQVPAYGPSETGSFHLPPPTAPAAPAPSAPAGAPVRAGGGIAPPPAKAVASLLAAALLCFAVGVWALTQM
ncbi:serine/threonine protein kinase [Streptomyces sp. NBC_01214]|uniref:serine/threonine-protein kinase n=1 Tax=Streptomyces sp. NBC_01214 TaxID=2903777 RepID=UPI00225412BB|nr:serine/threonine-protein kinase [Streptomyces sp. NBC_01214]MCX4800418.1 serine/threonine protein kinase [Streptomyces sp. NBC_01214]